MTTRRNTIHTGGLDVTRDEAFEHCLHHLNLAGLFFMSAPENIAQNLDECRRLLARGILGVEDPIYIAAVAFLEASHNAHETTRSKDAR